MALKAVEPQDEKAKLRALINDLTEKMVAALTETNPEGPAASDYGQALDRVCKVYSLLHGTGDFDQTGTALDGYRSKFNGADRGPARNRA